MRKLDVPAEHWDAMFAPSSCLVINTTVDPEGNVNAAAYGTCTRVCHDPVYIAYTLSDYSDSWANVAATGEFVVNVVPFEQPMLEKARVVGLPFERGVNELGRAGLTEMPSRIVRAPRIAECRVHFECVVEWTHPWLHRIMVCGRVVAVSIDEDCYEPSGVIRWERVRPAHYCGWPYGANFVPAHEPVWAELPYDGPRDWNPRLAPPDLDEPNPLLA